MTRQNNRTIVRFLLPVATFCALCSTDRAQSPSGDAHNFDIGGVQLDISVEQAQAALHAHDPSMKVQVLQSAAQLSEGMFTSAVVGVTGKQYPSPGVTGKSDGILISFTETEGNKAYSIARAITYDQSSTALPIDVLLQQMTEKYGKPHAATSPPGSGMFWSFGRDGKRSPNIHCTGYSGDVPVGEFNLPSSTNTFDSQCGTGLEIIIVGSFSNPHLAARITEVLTDGQLEYKNLMNIKKVHDDAAAKLLQKQKDNAEKQKSPF
jgi:hypothetical protein